MNKHGGARAGAGQPLKYGEPTVPIMVRVPQSKKEIIALKIKKLLKKFERK